MAVHIGKKIREEIHRQRFSVIEFSKKINRSRNVAYDIFDRESIDTELLHKIGKVLNCDFFSLYSAQKEFAHEGIKTFRNNQDTSRVGPEKLQQLQQENQGLKSEVTQLKKLINLIENKKPQGPGK